MGRIALLGFTHVVSFITAPTHSEVLMQAETARAVRYTGAQIHFPDQVDTSFRVSIPADHGSGARQLLVFVLHAIWIAAHKRAPDEKPQQLPSKDEFVREAWFLERRYAPKIIAQLPEIMKQVVANRRFEFHHPLPEHVGGQDDSIRREFVYDLRTLLRYVLLEAEVVVALDRVHTLGSLQRKNELPVS